ncbi:response regulator transcription factor [Streptomyces sp. HB132]|uniref:response regulator transcription factor n=1 Tax=Streptomyces sp. HB132 TaxID=767388 RepID=UPI001961AF1F|nr:response regulator transcription factor [Streptomyces sp. HB132]MBM7437333.1 DNA-binding NarL/FixJ family response regulator [Streptomyces sp. HB132]
MPDDVSRMSGQDRAAQSHTPRSTSSRDTPLGPEPSSPAFPATRIPPDLQQPMPAFPAAPAAPAPGPLRVVVADDNPVVRAGLGVLLGGRADIEVVAEAADGREAYDAAVRHRPDVILLDVRMPGVDGISALPHLVRVAPVMMLTYSRESDIVHEALRLGAGGYLVHGEFTADELVQSVRDTKSGRAPFTATAANALLAQVRQGAGGHPRQLPEGLGAALAASGPSDGPGSPAQPPESGAQAAPAPVLPSVRPAGRPRSLSRLQPRVAQSSSDSGNIRPQALNRQQYDLSSREAEVMELISSGMNNQQIAATCFISEKTVKNHINRIFTKLHSTSRSEAIARWLGTAPGPGPGPRGTDSHG